MNNVKRASLPFFLSSPTSAYSAASQRPRQADDTHDQYAVAPRARQLLFLICILRIIIFLSVFFVLLLLMFLAYDRAIVSSNSIHLKEKKIILKTTTTTKRQFPLF